jgi:pyruvate dehydrogenase E2 component (dihydrolipoamide acetyltransferase)
MPIDILMPSLSPTMKSGKIASWTKKEGDKVKSGDVILEIETDKAIMEFEAPETGKLIKILTQSGSEDVNVGNLIGIIIEEDEEINIDEYIQSKLNKNTNTINIPEEKKEEKHKSEKSEPQINTDLERKFISPLAKRIANENNVNFPLIEGSGPKGRVIKDDVEKAMLDTKNNTSCSNLTSRNTEEFTTLPLSGMRKVIGQRLLESKQNSPHFYVSIECGFDELKNTRARINHELSGKNIKISINDFIVKATAKALFEHPEIRTLWAGDSLKLANNIDICVAVSISNGLITPIVKNANLKSLTQISNEVKDLAHRAKEGKLSQNEYQGGCFTISNLGMYGVSEFSGIINPPQSAILSVASPYSKLEIKNGEVFEAEKIKLTLSADHRVIDGVDAAKFLNTLKSYIENPILLIV